MKKTVILLGLILFLAAILRLAFLNNVPVATTYDQLYYILNAKSFLATGFDISGSIRPFQLFLFQYPAGALTQAELPFFLQYPLLSFLPFSLAVAALPNAFLSILTVLLFFLVGEKLFDKKSALIISAIAAINPWFVVMGRTFYEPVPATFFYLLGFYILLIARKWKILFALPIFLLAFYSYIGTKLIFFPFVLLSVMYCYFVVHKKQYGKQYVTLLSIALLMLLFFVFELHQHPDNSRLSEIISPTNPAIASQVDALRKVSLFGPFTNVFVNKISLFIQIIGNNLLAVFNPLYLFAQGDKFFSLYRHGLFYFVDFLFLIIGAVFLFAQKRKLFIFFVSMILLATVPEIVHSMNGTNFTPHISLLFPFFIMIIGYGISQITEMKQKTQKIIVASAISAMYILSLFNFITVYFYQFPLHSEFFDSSPRIVSRYIDFAQKNNQSILVYSASADVAFKQYLFYSNSYTASSAQELNKAMLRKTLHYQNVTVLPCPLDLNIKNKKDLIIIDALCGKATANNIVSVAQLKDSGSTYNIINDKTCSQYNLQPYIANVKLSDLDVSKLDEKTFCEKFIIR